MDISRGDEEAWEAHVHTQIRKHDQRVKELREQGLRRVGLGTTQVVPGRQLTVDPAAQLEESQETE
eukprot:12095681-Heterocapsa_arctica.AAC.1